MAKTALVTGASGLLGRQVVRAFQRASYRTVGTGLTRAESSAILKVDLCNEDGVLKLITEVKYAGTLVEHKKQADRMVQT